MTNQPPLLDIPDAAVLVRSTWRLTALRATTIVAALACMAELCLWEVVPHPTTWDLAAWWLPIASAVSILVLFVGVLGLALMNAVGTGERVQLVRVTVVPAGLCLDGAVVIPPSQLSQGFLAQYDAEGRCLVQIDRQRGRSLLVIIPTYEDARRLLRSLGLDVTQRPALFTTVSWLYYFWEAELVLTLGLQGPAKVLFPGPGRSAVLAAILVLMVLAAIFYAIPGTIEVRGDGVAWEWLGFRRFVAYGELGEIMDDAVRRGDIFTPTSLKLPLIGGAVLTIPVSRPGKRGARLGPMILERIREAKYHRARGELPAIHS